MIDAATLQAMIDADELGLLDAPVKAAPMTGDERLVARFTEITAFVREHDREPSATSSDVAEMMLGARLDGLRSNDEHREALAAHDELLLLAPPEPPASIEEAAADDPLGLLDGGGLYELKHVPRGPVDQPEDKAQRRPSEDFADFEPLFKQCHAELQAGTRKLVPFKNEQQIRAGAFYVHSGVLTYVASEGERFKDSRGRWNARLRCIFENGTEADLLLRSLSSRLYKDGSKSVTDPIEDSHDAVEMQLDGRKGYVYVLRSLSDDPQVIAVPDLHKIGFTTTSLAERTSGARKHATFLGADVEEVAAYEMPAAMARGVEKLLHQFFVGARIDVWFERSSVTTAEANEWFSVPVEAIDQAIRLLQAEAIGSYDWDSEARAIRLGR